LVENFRQTATNLKSVQEEREAAYSNGTPRGFRIKTQVIRADVNQGGFDMASGTLRTILALMLTAVCGPARALFESDNKVAKDAKISMVDAITTAEKTIPGQPVHVEMGRDAGHTVYQIQIRDKDNKSRWVYVDTMTGAVTEAKR
jgi:hypothetical protein